MSVFKQGDLVELVSGGPQMVVVTRPRPRAIGDQVEVSWFESRGQLRRVWLPPQALKPSTESAPS